MEIRRIDSSYIERIIETFLMSFEYFEPEESEYFFSDPSLWEYVWGAFDRKGVHIIMLDPFKHDFYVKLGFGLGFESLEYTVDCSLLSGDMEEDNLKLVSRRLLEKDEMRELISQTRKTLWETSRYTEAIEIDA